jgi:hypothetical protein
MNAQSRPAAAGLAWPAWRITPPSSAPGRTRSRACRGKGFSVLEVRLTSPEKAITRNGTDPGDFYRFYLGRSEDSAGAVIFVTIHDPRSGRGCRGHRPGRRARRRRRMQETYPGSSPSDLDFDRWFVGRNAKPTATP